MTEAAKPAREPAPAPGLGMFQKLGSLFRTYAVPRNALVVPTPFRRDDRNCYTFLVPKRWVSDETGTSPILLYEDGEPLGPGHAGHDDIRTLGRGRFSHWGPKVYFSTSDNSDPNTNGRTYSVVPPEGWRQGRKGVIPQQPSEERAPTQDWAEQETAVELAAGQRVAVEWSLASINAETIFRLPDSSFAVAVPHDWPSDAESTSTLMLLEDGKPLPLPHSAHADIPILGKGRYSHWGGELRFAASDDSDPRVNGRRYEIARADAFVFTHAPSAPEKEAGRCWVLNHLPAEWPSDDSDGPSLVALLEDGKVVGQPHASHDEIRKLGGGRYSHWGRQLLFSTSDNSDPTTNGRTYTVVRLEAR